MKYCCYEFEIKTRREPSFDAQDDGTWSISGCSQCYVVIGMKFCPFCGEDLESRFKVEPAGDGYVVFDRGERGAYFHTQEGAENHVEMLRQA